MRKASITFIVCTYGGEGGGGGRKKQLEGVHLDFGRAYHQNSFFHSYKLFCVYFHKLSIIAYQKRLQLII